jgi:hypothetical protein
VVCSVTSVTKQCDLTALFANLHANGCTGFMSVPAVDMHYISNTHSSEPFKNRTHVDKR